MERAKKTWLLEIILTAILAALAGLWGWTALRVVENGERIIEVKAELQKELGSEIAEVRVELGREIAEVRVDLQRDLGREIAKNREQIAEVNAKLDLLIGALDISVVPKESAGAGPSGAERGGFQAGAGETATE